MRAIAQLVRAPPFQGGSRGFESHSPHYDGPTICFPSAFMKLDLKEPYKSDFKSAYCYKNKEPRRVVSLIKENGSRTSTSYARYLMSCHLGRYLDEDEHVDHINGDPLDDRIENLQILSVQENNSKSASTKYLKCVCPVCKKEFEVQKSKTYWGGSGNKKYQNCSRSCGGRASHIDDQVLLDHFKIIDELEK